MYDSQRLKIAELTLSVSKKGDYEFGFMNEKGKLKTYYIDFEFGYWVDIKSKALQTRLDKQLTDDTRSLRNELTLILGGIKND